MTHTVHVLTNSQSEAYILVLNMKKGLESIVHEALRYNAAYDKKNPQRVRFVRENPNDLTVEHVTVPNELGDINEIRSFRDEVIAQYASDGFLVVDETHYEVMDSPANENFAEVTKNVDNRAAWIAYYGQENLLKARASLTVGEMINAYPWPPKGN